INRRRAEDSLAFAGAVAGSVIHDFRNPMSALRLDAQLLQHEADKGDAGRPEKMRQLARRMEQTLGRMDDLLREFLVLSAPGNNEPVVFDVNACVRDCVDLMKLRFERADVQLVIDLAEAPLRVDGEPLQFKRAVLNILNNACHFAPAGSAVTVRSRRQGRQALLEIADEGPGIPPVERRRVFRMFYTRCPGGTGIGLALARTAVENCGGRIRVLTPPTGRGSLFAVTLPLES
ncbi:MAG: sensor histidine kinase, partial [Kiritimatiellia bacterium]